MGYDASFAFYVLLQSIWDAEEAKGGSPKRVFISGQTTHITIEEEHPSGEDINPESQAEEDDFDLDMNMSHLPVMKRGNISWFYLVAICSNTKSSLHPVADKQK